MRKLSLFILALTFLGCFELKAQSLRPVDKWGQLQVQGANLCDSEGNPVTLRGVSFGWHNLWPRFYNAQAVEWIVDDWNASVIRAAMGIQIKDNYIDNQRFSLQCIEPVVEACIQNGVYVLIDWHAHKTYQDEAVKFFGEMAKKYGKYPNVFYEIFNEPVNQSWDSLKIYATACINEIRKYDPDNIILVGNPHWDQDIDLVADSPITGYSNIMYTVHFYAATHKQYLRDKTVDAVRRGIPVFISECGSSEANGNGKLDAEEWNNWIEMMEENKISWIGWSISDKKETCSMLYPSASSNGNWKEKDLSPSGKLMRESLHKYNKCAFASKPAIPRDENIEKNVEKTLARMTLDEKIGQMLELNLDVMGKKTMENGKLVWKLNETMLDTIISKYKVGSFLNVAGPTTPTIEQWQEWIGLIQNLSMKYMGIPTIYGLDQNHGTSYTQNGTLFPQAINVAASFNTEIAQNAAQICAYETRAGNCPWTYSPTLDLGRDPRWARIWESYGEDPLVNAKMAQAAVRGFQGPDNNHVGPNNIATSVKHYMGYGAPFSGKDRTPAYISTQMLREQYFAPFKAAIQAGALTIMVNSASINGMPVHASYELLTQWLKEDLNWDGMIISDWADINNLYQREKVAKDKKDAIRIAINAGIDMSMDPYNVDFCILLKELVNEGEVPMSRVDDAVRRILRLKYRLGLFDQPNTLDKNYPKFGSKEHALVALKSAEECMVLLKNDKNILPITKGKKILLTGPNANQMRCLNGGWSYTWQGSNAEHLSVQYNTIYEALCNKYGKENIILEQGVTYNERGAYWEENEPQINKAVSAAKKADIIVACIGENSYCETPGNLKDLTLSENQRNLVKALSTTGKPIVLVLNEGRPRLIADIEPLAQGIIDILLPGNYGGDALANLMTGDANFSGKLPMTYPSEINSLINYDYKVSEKVNTMAGAYDYDAKVTQQWPFGFGLSYTTFAYSNLKVDKTNFNSNDVLTISVDVKNTGSKVGKESVLLYSSDLIASLVPDSRRLRAFAKIELQPNETKTVTFKLPASDLAFVGNDGKWILEKGDFDIVVNDQVSHIVCNETKKWETPNIE